LRKGDILGPAGDLEIDLLHSAKFDGIIADEADESCQAALQGLPAPREMLRIRGKPAPQEVPVRCLDVGEVIRDVLDAPEHTQSAVAIFDVSPFPQSDCQEDGSEQQDGGDASDRSGEELCGKPILSSQPLAELTEFGDRLAEAVWTHGANMGKAKDVP
jgi:hypothetical protein